MALTFDVLLLLSCFCCCQVADLKAGKSVDKPIYNHVTGNLDAPEKIDSCPVSNTAHNHTTARHSAGHCVPDKLGRLFGSLMSTGVRSQPAGLQCIHQRLQALRTMLASICQD
jgi:hypothetical protein